MQNNTSTHKQIQDTQKINVRFMKWVLLISIIESCGECVIPGLLLHANSQQANSQQANSQHVNSQRVACEQVTLDLSDQERDGQKDMVDEYDFFIDNQRKEPVFSYRDCIEYYGSCVLDGLLRVHAYVATKYAYVKQYIRTSMREKHNNHKKGRIA